MTTPAPMTVAQLYTESRAEIRAEAADRIARQRASRDGARAMGNDKVANYLNRSAREEAASAHRRLQSLAWTAQHTARILGEPDPTTR